MTVFKKLLRNPTSLAGIIILVIFVIIAVCPGTGAVARCVHDPA